MSDSNVHTIVLKNSEEKRLEELFNHFSKTVNDIHDINKENNILKFNEFLMLSLDRNMLTNRFGLRIFYEKYQKAIEAEIKPTASSLLAPPSATRQTGHSPMQKVEIKNDKTNLNRLKFNYLITLLADLMYASEKNRIEKMFNELLVEKAMINKDAVEGPRCMMFDEVNKKLLTTQCVKILCDYENELKRAFTLYYSENIFYNKMLLEWHELSLQNKKMTCFGFVKFLKDSEIVPHVLSIEQLEEIMMKILPAVSVKEHHFYSNSKLIHIYEKESNSNIDPKYDGDPLIYFHEFQLILCRIAFETFPKDQNNEKRDIEKPLYRFFDEILCIRKNNEINKPLPNMNRKFFKVLTASYENNQEEEEEKKNQDPNNTTFEDDFQDSKKLLLEYANKNQFESVIAKIDFLDIYKTLDRELPILMDPPATVPENPPPYKIQPKIIGEQPPKPPPEKNKPRPKPPKKPQRKKGEPEPRPIIWGGEPQNDPKTSHEHIVDFSNKLDFGEVKISDYQRATLSDIEVAPCLIKEIIYPIEIPFEIRIYVEAAITAHNCSNYAFALENFEQAKNKWQAESKKYELPEQVQLFFEFSAGQVFESSGRDDFALLRFMNCKSIGERLEFNNPDRALAFCGIGSVLYHMEEYKLAARCFLKAREIRETILGGDTIDTATTYNNLGCCMFFLKRIKEANAYFKLAQAILEAELGMFHFRTITVSRNVGKSKKEFMEFVPEYKTLWMMYEKDPYKKASKKKKKGGKKK